MTDGAKTQQGELVIYRAENGRFQLEAKLVGETVWLSMNQIADLFGVNVPAISKHVRNIYEVGELSRRATVSKMETVRKEGRRQVTRKVEFYNLDMILLSPVI